MALLQIVILEIDAHPSIDLTLTLSMALTVIARSPMLTLTVSLALTLPPGLPFTLALALTLTLTLTASRSLSLSPSLGRRAVGTSRRTDGKDEATCRAREQGGEGRGVRGPATCVQARWHGCTWWMHVHEAIHTCAYSPARREFRTLMDGVHDGVAMMARKAKNDVYASSPPICICTYTHVHAYAHMHMYASMHMYTCTRRVLLP